MTKLKEGNHETIKRERCDLFTEIVVDPQLWLYKSFSLLRSLVYVQELIKKTFVKAVISIKNHTEIDYDSLYEYCH